MENLHRLSRHHLDILIQYMERYPRLALATARTREAHVRSKYMWEKIARTLNKLDKNIRKTGHGWSRYWGDRKFKARRKYTVIQKRLSEGTLCTSMALDEYDERIIKIITDKDGNLLPVNSVTDDMIKVQAGSDEEMIPDVPEIEVDIKPIIHEDPIRIEETKCLTEVKRKTKKIAECNRSNIEDKRRIEAIRREMLEFELKRQRQLFEIEKMQVKERHKREMEILELKKQLMLKELNN